MPYKSLWLFLKDFARNPKSSFIAQKSLFFEPPSIGNLRRKPRTYWEFAQKPLP